MERIIINNRTEFDWSDIIRYIDKVINMGKISGDKDCYCYVSTFKLGNYDGAIGELAVFCDKTKTGFKFDVMWEVV